MSAKVQLIPWDFTSREHTERAYQQRVACGWRSEEVEKWVAMSKAGTKTLYWLVLPESLQNRDELLAKHRAKYPQENSPIHDTAATLWLTPRVASGAAIHPIGHIALDLRPEEDQRMGLPGSGVVWIATLYVSWALQRAGMGGEAMKATERLAAQPPLNGTVAVLDVVPTEFHLRDDVVEKVYLSQGNPKPVVSNEEWYKRRGYEEFRREATDSYMWPNPKTGGFDIVPLLYLKKRLA